MTIFCGCLNVYSINVLPNATNHICCHHFEISLDGVCVSYVVVSCTFENVAVNITVYAIIMFLSRGISKFLGG